MPYSSSPPLIQAHTMRQTGLTLIELLTTLTVLAVLSAIAAPSFTSLFERWRTSQAVSSLESSLAFARSEAIKRGGGISIVRNACNNQSNAWQCGWSVVLDSNADGTANTDSAPLLVIEALPSVTATASADATFISADRWGVMRLENNANSFHLNIHPKNKEANKGSTLCIRSGGRIQLFKNTSICP